VKFSKFRGIEQVLLGVMVVYQD